MAFLKNLYHHFLAWAGSVIYRHPSRELFVIGVTGTKGKSTVVELINAVLTADGKKTALLDSVRMKIGDRSEPNPTSNTMPGRFAIQRFLRRAADAGCAYAIVEVTSQGVVQNRHRFIDFDAAVFLNLHREHIESHGSFEAYRAAKVRFFADVASRSAKKSKHFIINAEDGAREFFADAAAGHGAVRYFSREQFIAQRLAQSEVEGLAGSIDGIGEWFSVSFNLANAAAAESFARCRAIPWETVRRALTNFTGVPGRMEVVSEEPFKVVVDYAHTPDSLTLVYESLAGAPKGSPTRNLSGRQSSVVSRKLICVLGSAGGGRDTWKRQEFGRITSHWCDRVFVTDEDPYDEDPMAIISQICAGADRNALPGECLVAVADRGEAIAKAISCAKPGDTVVITGKGSERFIHLAHGKTRAWSDRKAVEKALAARSAD